MESKYQEAFKRLINDDYVDKSGNQNELDIKLIQELVDKATPKNPILSKAWKVKMTAKEMFEALGYTYYKSNNMILYEISEINYFIFSPDKEITVGDYGIDVATLEAINQQCKELGWI